MFRQKLASLIPNSGVVSAVIVEPSNKSVFAVDEYLFFHKLVKRVASRFFIALVLVHSDISRVIFRIDVVSKNVFVFVRALLAHILFEQRQIVFMRVVRVNSRRGNRFFAAENIRQHRPIVDRFYPVEQASVVVHFLDLRKFNVVDRRKVYFNIIVKLFAVQIVGFARIAANKPEHGQCSLVGSVYAENLGELFLLIRSGFFASHDLASRYELLVRHRKRGACIELLVVGYALRKRGVYIAESHTHGIRAYYVHILVIEKKMPAAFDNMMTRQIQQANILRRIFRQVFAQMKYRRKLLEIILIVIIRIAEKYVLGCYPIVLIFCEKRAVV